MKYVRAGEPVSNSAAERNEIAESVNFVRDVLRNSQSGIIDPTTELPCIVDVSNSTGTNFERHEAVYCSAPIITPTDNAADFASYRRFVILSPTGWAHLGRLAILLEPVPTGKIGKAVVSGTIQTRVNVIEEWHEYADVEEVSGGRTLQSNPDGSSTCQILWKEAGTGEKWATVRLSNAGQFHLVGKPTGYGISAASDYGGVRTPGTGTIQVYYLDPSTEELTALEDINGDPCYLTVYNLGTSTIAVTEWVLPHCDRWGVWWVEPATGGLEYASVTYSGNTSGSGVGHSTIKSSSQSAGVSSVTNHEGSLITAGADYFQITDAGTYTYWYTIAANIVKTAGTASYPQYGRIFPWLRQDDGTPIDLTPDGRCRISMIWANDVYAFSNSVASQANDCVTFDAAASDKIYLAIWFQQLASLAGVTFQAQNAVGTGVLFKHM